MRRRRGIGESKFGKPPDFRTVEAGEELNISSRSGVPGMVLLLFWKMLGIVFFGVAKKDEGCREGIEFFRANVGVAIEDVCLDGKEFLCARVGLPTEADFFRLLLWINTNSRG